ncbi:MAG: GEVED domain-containing protein [Planctomycetota bacterium]
MKHDADRKRSSHNPLRPFFRLLDRRRKALSGLSPFRHRRLALEPCESRRLLTTVELGVLADAAIYETVTNDNASNGSGQHLFAGVTLTGLSRRSMIQFDFSSIPAGATIDSAELQLNVSIAAPGSGDRDVSLFPLLTEWEEGPSDPNGAEGMGAPSQLGDSSWLFRSFPTVAWALAPGGDFNPAFPSATTPVGFEGKYSWSSEEMTIDIANWMNNPDDNFGWMIVGDEFDIQTAKRFDSRENLTEANRPKLIVDYLLPTITGPDGPINDDEFDVIIDFNEPIQSFSVSDIDVTGGEATELFDNGDGVFVATIEADGDGPVTVNLPAEAAIKENGGLTAEAETPFNVVIDTVRPEPIIQGPDSPVLSQTFDVTIDFGEVALDFEADDISVINGSVQSLMDDGGGIFTASVLGDLSSTVTIDVNADVATDLAGNPNISATRFTVQVPNPTQDFGDAPPSYPVTLADNGARHFQTSLFLGSTVDLDLNGVPSAAADSDGADEDGIVGLTTLVADQAETLATVSVFASEAGRLDGWIDFNRDGDWDDLGENVFQNTSVLSGQNDFNVTIPAGSVPGETFARLRVSSVGGLQPTGQALSGEVEDHLLILQDPSQPYPVTAPLIDPQVTVEVVNGELIIESPTMVQFRGPADEVDSLELIGTDADETISIDLGSFPIPSGGLQLQGEGGRNTLQLVGDNSMLDLLAPETQITEIDVIDLSDPDRTNVALDASIIASLQPVDNRLEVLLDVEDVLSFSDFDEWRMTEPVLVDGVFRLVASHQFSAAQFEARTPRPWQNPASVNDINNDGNIAALDALVIINELDRRAFSQPDGLLDDPLSLPQWPNLYYDHSGDNLVSALDALRVINRIAASPEGELIAEGEWIDSHSPFDEPDESFDVAGPVMIIDAVMRKTADFAGRADYVQDSIGLNPDELSPEQLDAELAESQGDSQRDLDDEFMTRSH